MRAIRVLVANDDDAFVDIVAKWLSRRGFMVMATSDGAEAVATVEQVQPDVAIVESGPDGSSNSQLVRQLQTLEPSLPLVIFCGLPQEAVVETGRSVGIAAYVARPCSLSDLEASIRQVLYTQTATTETAVLLEPLTHPLSFRYIAPDA
jgi:DNA-binding response OmpR family regulator